ncbi:MAG: phosphatase PAP2 family protein [Dysgonomonas sp.]
MKTGHIIAQIFSVVFQPLFMSFYGVLLLFYYTNFFFFYANMTWFILGTVLLFTCLIPMLFILSLRMSGVVKDYTLSEKKERHLPYIICLLSNIALVVYLYNVNLQIWFLGLLAAPVLVLLIGFIVNFFWKISAHMLGIGGLIGGLMSVCVNVNKQNPFLLFMLLFILAGCLGVSRLYLKRHTPAQVYIGFGAGFLAAYFVVWLSANL